MPSEFSDLFGSCTAYLQSQGGQPGKGAGSSLLPAVTLSRQCGARVGPIAEKLLARLQATSPKDGPPWALFDKDLVQRVLDDHALPGRLAKFMPEDSPSEVRGVLGELLGLHPSLWTLFHHTTDTLYKLARRGNVILVGRGANVITRSLRNTFHVRLVGSHAHRVRFVMKTLGLNQHAAEDHIKKEDHARERFMRQHFSVNIDDPLLYDVTLNTDFLSDDAVADLIHAGLRSLPPAE